MEGISATLEGISATQDNKAHISTQLEMNSTVEAGVKCAL